CCQLMLTHRPDRPCRVLFPPTRSAMAERIEVPSSITRITQPRFSTARITTRTTIHFLFPSDLDVVGIRTTAIRTIRTTEGIRTHTTHRYDCKLLRVRPKCSSTATTPERWTTST